MQKRPETIVENNYKPVLSNHLPLARGRMAIFWPSRARQREIPHYY